MLPCTYLQKRMLLPLVCQLDNESLHLALGSEALIVCNNIQAKMKAAFWRLLLLAASASAATPSSSKPGNILVWLPLSSKSHYITWRPLLYELAKKGNRLTIFKAVPDVELCGRREVECADMLNGDLAWKGSTKVFEGDQWDFIS
jgi:hypothetical protein